MTAALRLLLAALAYGTSALAAAVTLAVIEQGTWGWPVAAWFVAAYALVWGWSRGAPKIPASVRRGVDGCALVGLVWFLYRVLGGGGADFDWRAAAPVVLVFAQMLRALVVTTPGEAESFLATGLALALYSATRTGWTTGALFLAAFMWMWLAAMTLVQVLAEGERRSRGGGMVASTANPWRTLRSGLWLSLVVVALGIGGFLVVRGPASGTGAGEGAATGGWSAAGTGGAKYSLEMTFASQAGPHAPVREQYRIKAPLSLSRFRLQAFDTYSADGWRLSREAAVALPEGTKVAVQYGLGLGLPSSVEGVAVDLEIAATGAEGDVLLTAGWPLELEGAFPGPLQTDEDGGVRLRYPFPPGFRYRLRTWCPDWDHLSLAEARAAGADRVGERYLALPATLPARVAARAGEWTSGAASPWARALSLAAALRAGPAYRLELATPPSGGAGVADPVDWFLFGAPAGNCVDFASAFAVMARSIGVPSRLVAGYLAHRRDESTGEWVVTTMDAHAWCEIALEGIGWVPVDPTPAGRAGGTAVGGTATPAPSASSVPAAGVPDEPAGRAPVPAAKMLAALAAAWPWLLLGGAAFWLARGFWRAVRERLRYVRPRRAAGEIQRAFQRVCEAAGKRGRERREAQTPAEYARALRGIFPGLAADLARLADLATEAEFSGRAPTAQVRAEAKALGRRLVAALSKI
ncbi:MAG: transglutaminaseTgpA domain-containing protein [Candidatus Coatesbacteria bacterium]